MDNSDRKYEVIERNTYRGMDYLIIELRGEHNNGYVRIPEGHVLHGIPYDGLLINCHGGLTFSGDHLKGCEGWWIGFDCAHYGDLMLSEVDKKDCIKEGTYKTPEFVRTECKSIIDQIVDKGLGAKDLSHFPYGLESLLGGIYQWGVDRGITVENGASARAQLKKLKEEFDELTEGIDKNDLPLIRDSIGDMYVVLQQIARLSNLTMQECLQAAWEDIKDRKGQMRHGVFVKQADIDLIGQEALNGAQSAEELRSLIELAKDQQ